MTLRDLIYGLAILVLFTVEIRRKDATPVQPPVPCTVTIHTTRDYRLTYVGSEGCSPRYIIKEQ